MEKNKEDIDITKKLNEIIRNRKHQAIIFEQGSLKRITTRSTSSEAYYPGETGSNNE